MFLRLGGGRAAIALAFAVPLVGLLATVRTSVGTWDTADLQTVAWIAGIPYPTGYPLYVIVGWLWTHALPLGTVAARLNALSAIAVAGSAATVCATALLFDAAALFAVLAGWAFAFAHTIWYRATYADAHPLGFAVAFAAIACATAWARRGDARALIVGIVLGGVALALDNTTVLILLGGLIVAFARPVPVRAATLAALAAALIVVASYAYLPLRSAQLTAAHADPTLALGIEPGRPFFDDHHPSTPDGFRALVTGSEWGTSTTLGRLFTLDAIRSTERRFAPVLGYDYPGGLIVLALAGIVVAAFSDAVVTLGLVLAAVIPALFGGSYVAEADPERYVFMLYALAAVGIALAADRIVRAVVVRYVRLARVIVASLLGLALATEVLHGGDLFAMRADDGATRFGARVVADTRDGAVIVAPWDYATPLGYRAYVEHALGDRIVVCALADDYVDLYKNWLAKHQVVLVAAHAPDLDGFRTRRISFGKPGLWEVLPR